MRHPPPPADHPLELVDGLLDHSLLRRIETTDGSSRLRMLTVLREDVERRLDEAGETALLRERHARWALALAEEAEPELTGPDQVAWLDRLETEHDNLRAALAWALEGEGEERVEVGLRLAGAVWRFWNVRGYLAEGRGLIEALLVVGPLSGAALRARATVAAGTLAQQQGDLEGANRLLTGSLGICREIGDDAGTARVLNVLGVVAVHQGDAETARRYFEESIAVKRALADDRGLSASLINLGVLVLEQRDVDTFKSCTEEALAIKRRIGDRQGVGMCLHNLGEWALNAGQYEKASALLQESLEVRRGIDDWSSAETLVHLGPWRRRNRRRTSTSPFLTHQPPHSLENKALTSDQPRG